MRRLAWLLDRMSQAEGVRVGRQLGTVGNFIQYSEFDFSKRSMLLTVSAQVNCDLTRSHFADDREFQH